MWEINRGRFTNAREGATAEIQMRSPLLVARMIPSFRDSEPNTVPSTESTLRHATSWRTQRDEQGFSRTPTNPEN